MADQALKGRAMVATLAIIACTGSCVTRNSQRLPRSTPHPAPRPAPVVVDASTRPAPSPTAATIPVDAGNPAPPLAPLLDTVTQRLLASGLGGPLWVEATNRSSAPVAQATLHAALVRALQRARIAIAPDRSGATAVAELRLYGRTEPVDGQHRRTMVALLLLLDPATGELRWIGGAQQDQALGPAPGRPTIHPTTAELLEMSRDTGRALRQKLQRRQLASLRFPMIVEAIPMRAGTGQRIDGDLVSYWMLRQVLRLSRVRAVLAEGEHSGSTVTPDGRDGFGATYVLRAKLSRSGGEGRDTRLAFHLRARLAPLIATDAPVFEASSTMLPPLAPDTP
jgi:hypothetical protein